jgi:hypothetical protein
MAFSTMPMAFGKEFTDVIYEPEMLSLGVCRIGFFNNYITVYWVNDYQIWK